jgi:hypothetical protein
MVTTRHRVQAKLAAFGAVLVLTFALAFAVGSAVEVPTDDPTPAHDPAANHVETTTTSHPAQHEVDEP